ncbi:MAG: Bacterial domain [Candidatus Parcubacteria bacterium]|jgi:membrane protein YdbS with pleckstrin-like domain
MKQAMAAADDAAETRASENDVTLYRARPHLLALLWPFVLALAVGAAAFAAERHLPGLGARIGFRVDQAASLETVCRWLLLAAAAVFTLNVIAAVAECAATRYVVTPSRVIATTKLLRSTSAVIYLAKIEAVVRDQGPIERVFDAGSVTLISTGGHRDTITNVRGFSRFASELERAIDARHAPR